MTDQHSADHNPEMIDVFRHLYREAIDRLDDARRLAVAHPDIFITCPDYPGWKYHPATDTIRQIN